jgi:hypothetical protein
LSRKLLCLATALALAAGVIGCGASAKTSTVPPGLGALPPDKRAGPEGTVFRLWRKVQVRSYQTAALEYDKRVLDALGTRDVIGALSMQQLALSVTTPKVISTNRTPVGTLVIVNAMSKGRATGRYSFLVGRRAGKWKVRYDTLLGEMLGAYVQKRVQQKIAPNAKEPAPQAGAAGERASTTYRELFAPKPLAPTGSASTGRPRRGTPAP